MNPPVARLRSRLLSGVSGIMRKMRRSFSVLGSVVEDGRAVSTSVVITEEVTPGAKEVSSGERDEEGFKVTEISRFAEDSIPGNELSAGELVAADMGTR
jgi:hypothetical protein